MPTTIVWFRQDLRLEDNPALAAAVKMGGVAPVYIWSPEEEGGWAPGGASRWWLHHALEALDAQLRAHGSRLIVRRGPALDALKLLARDAVAGQVFWNRRCEPAAVARDTQIRQALKLAGLKSESFNGALMVDPVTFRNKSGEPFKVFTPFWKAAAKTVQVGVPALVPARLPAPPKWPESESIAGLGLLPKQGWDAGLRAAWKPGAEGARAALDTFAEGPLPDYPERRDFPAEPATSRLSPYLHTGEIGPRQVYRALMARAGAMGGAHEAGAEAHIRQLYWREFAHYLLYHFPHTAGAPLREAFNRFPWMHDADALRAWQRGQTGYPIVDAGMRELWHTGWMHNRVRMVVASFLVKDLLVPWQDGARWFWDTLVDADLANNTLGWQWTAGCGADAAPFFRVFNPVTQGEKFDPAGAYVRRWIPELAALPDALIHRPWEAPAETLAAAGVELGVNYPKPIVDHKAAAERALAAYAHIKSEADA